MDKSMLRKVLLQERQALAIADWQQKSWHLCDQLRQSRVFVEARTVLAYFSIRREPDLSSLFNLDKVWGFPRCVGQELCWHHWSPQHTVPLQPGRYGILAPPPDAPEILPSQVDLILVPAIACDAYGHRLGYGGGFYDRLLSHAAWQGVATIGIIFEMARVDALPHDPWDQPLHAICTDIGFYPTQNC